MSLDLTNEQVAFAESLRERASEAAQQWVPGAQVTQVDPLTGGASSLTFVAEMLGVPQAHSRVVLKVAPPGLPPVRNRDVLRQGRLMAALYGRPGVPVPPLLFQEAGAAPYGAAEGRPRLPRCRPRSPAPPEPARDLAVRGSPRP